MRHVSITLEPCNPKVGLKTSFTPAVTTLTMLKFDLVASSGNCGSQENNWMKRGQLRARTQVVHIYLERVPLAVWEQCCERELLLRDKRQKQRAFSRDMV